MKARAKAFDGGKPYKETAAILSKSIATNVQSGGRPKWRPRKGSYSHPILDKTGKMRDVAESTALKWQKTSDGYTNKVTSTGYGFIHQYRGVRTKISGSIQKIIRKFVVIQQTEKTKMIDAFRKAFLK
jgi:phage gpG-like protein